MTEYHVRSRPGGTTVRVSRPGGVTRVRTRLAGGSAGGAGLTGDSEIVADSTTLTGPPHTIAVAAAGSIDITVTLPDATVDDKGLVWYIRNLNSDSVVYVANLAEGDETITESKGLLVAGIETDTPGTYTWMKVGFVSETAAAGGGADLSDATPQALGTAAAGTGTAAARDDHVHAMPTAADVGADADGAAQAVADTLGTAATKDAGSAGGVAELDVTGKVPSAQLPSYVDDVVEVANFAALPGTGETGKIYVTVDTNVTYRWSGSAYVEISASLALGETSSTAYRGDRGKTAYDHSQVTTGNPHGTTAADIGAAATSHTHTGTQVTVDASGFNGNLTTSDDTVQEIAQKLDDLVIPAAGIADPGGANDDFLQRKAGAWTYRTPAQVKTDLGVTARLQAGFPTLSGGIGSDNWGLPPGCHATLTAATSSVGTGTAWVVPFSVDSDVTITAAAVRATATASGSVTRCAIVRLDNTLQPSSLVHEFTTFDTSSSGVKSQTGLSVALTPGIYATYTKTEVAAPTLVYMSGFINALMPMVATLSAGGGMSAVMSASIGAGAYANPPAGGSAFNGTPLSLLFLRWTNP